MKLNSAADLPAMLCRFKRWPICSVKVQIVEGVVWIVDFALEVCGRPEILGVGKRYQIHDELMFWTILCGTAPLISLEI